MSAATRRRLAVLVLTLTGAVTAGSPAAPTAEPALPISFGGPFTLTDQYGRVRNDRDFAGRFMLIYFGYTYCPDICPTNLAVIGAALKRLGPAGERVQPIMISVDPARDSAQRLGPYVEHFHPRMLALRGTGGALDAVLRAYRVHRLRVVPRGADPVREYLINHSPITYLMGPDGKFVTLFPHDTTAEFMAATLGKYLAG